MRRKNGVEFRAAWVKVLSRYWLTKTVGLQNRPDYNQAKNGKLQKPPHLVAPGTTGYKSNDQAAQTRCGTGHNLFFLAHPVVTAHLYPTKFLAIFLRADYELFMGERHTKE